MNVQPGLTLTPFLCSLHEGKVLAMVGTCPDSHTLRQIFPIHPHPTTSKYHSTSLKQWSIRGQRFSIFIYLNYDYQYLANENHVFPLNGSSFKPRWGGKMGENVFLGAELQTVGMVDSQYTW